MPLAHRAPARAPAAGAPSDRALEYTIVDRSSEVRRRRARARRVRDAFARDIYDEFEIARLLPKETKD